MTDLLKRAGLTKDAILVTGLKTQMVMRGDTARYYDLQNPPLYATDGETLVPNEPLTVNERIVPFSEIWKNGNQRLYIAYSHEVEELLKVPINAIIEAREQAQARADRFESMTPWQHIKLAFKKIFSK